MLCSVAKKEIEKNNKIKFFKKTFFKKFVQDLMASYEISNMLQKWFADEVNLINKVKMIIRDVHKICIRTCIAVQYQKNFGNCLNI